MLETLTAKLELKSAGGPELRSARAGAYGSNARDRHAAFAACSFEAARALWRDGCQNLVIVAAGQNCLHGVCARCCQRSCRVRKRDRGYHDLRRDPRDLAHPGQIEGEAIGNIHRRRCFARKSGGQTKPRLRIEIARTQELTLFRRQKRSEAFSMQAQLKAERGIADCAADIEKVAWLGAAA